MASWSQGMKVLGHSVGNLSAVSSSLDRGCRSFVAGVGVDDVLDSRVVDVAIQTRYGGFSPYRPVLAPRYEAPILFYLRIKYI